MISKTLELDNTFCPVLMACGCNMIRSIVLPDRKLLACYVAEGSEPAFAEVVAQHVNLVYSAALRRTGGNVELAKEATQLVFTSLARKAGSLPDNVVLASWLHKATHYASLQPLRTERRRRAREQEALAMNTLQPRVHAAMGSGLASHRRSPRPARDGLITTEIAKRLCLSVPTVTKYRRKIGQLVLKLGFRPESILHFALFSTLFMDGLDFWPLEVIATLM